MSYVFSIFLYHFLCIPSVRNPLLGNNEMALCSHTFCNPNVIHNPCTLDYQLLLLDVSFLLTCLRLKIWAMIFPDKLLHYWYRLIQITKCLTQMVYFATYQIVLKFIIFAFHLKWCNITHYSSPALIIDIAPISDLAVWFIILRFAV